MPIPKACEGWGSVSGTVLRERRPLVLGGRPNLAVAPSQRWPESHILIATACSVTYSKLPGMENHTFATAYSLHRQVGDIERLS